MSISDLVKNYTLIGIKDCDQCHILSDYLFPMAYIELNPADHGNPNQIAVKKQLVPIPIMFPVAVEKIGNHVITTKQLAEITGLCLQTGEENERPDISG